VIHGTLLAAVHVHPGLTVTVMLPLVVPSNGTSRCVVEMPYVHAAGVCAIVTVLPAIVTVPVRPSPAFAATCRVTDPLPLPDVADVMLIHGVLVWTVQLQPVSTATVAVTVPPAADTDVFAGVTSN
jgi:hypothetical protein